MFKKEQLLELTNVNSKLDVFAKVAEFMKSNDSSLNTDEIIGKLLIRESQVSTAFENGIAIPHARVNGITQPIILVARFNPIIWSEQKEEETELAIFIMSNEAGSNDHLKMLSAIAGKLIDDKFAIDLKSADGEKLESLLSV